MRNYSVTTDKEKIIASDDKEEPEDSSKEKIAAPISGKKHNT